MIGITKDDAFEIVDTISKAREIVFCRDCKYWMREPRYCLRLDEHPYRAKHWDADDFCSRGEKKDEID